MLRNLQLSLFAGDIDEKLSIFLKKGTDPKLV